MTIHTNEVIKEWEVETLLDFLNKVGFKKELKKKYPEIKDIMSGNIYNYISSDEETIQELLEESPNHYTIDFINNRHGGYWIIKQITHEVKE